MDHAVSGRTGSAQHPRGRLRENSKVAGNRRRRRGANPIDITVVVSFNREGVILGHPRVAYKSEQASRTTTGSRTRYGDGDVATLYAVAIYRSIGRSCCGPAFSQSLSEPATLNPRTRRGDIKHPENTLLKPPGPVTIEMRPFLSTEPRRAVKELVREGFYDGIVFHRVIGFYGANPVARGADGTGGSGKN